MEKLDAILPGIGKFIREVLAKEDLSPEVEKQRLHYVELLDVNSLRAPPRIPAPLPSHAATGNGKPGPSSDLLAANRSAAFRASTADASKHVEEENVYNEVNDVEYSVSLSRRPISVGSCGTYEEPISMSTAVAKQQPSHSAVADNVAECGGGGTSDDSDTDYERYGDDDEDCEDGSEQLSASLEAGAAGAAAAEDAAAAAGSETILLPRVKSKKKKKISSVSDIHLKPYDALLGRQYEGDVYARTKLSWNRFYCVISQSVLYFYKNRADLQPRFHLQLDGHDLLLADKDKGRNNVLRISKPGTETLFVSCDTMEKANEWYKQLVTAVSTSSAGSASEEKTATAFYCSHDEMISAASAAAAAAAVATTRSGSTAASHSAQPPIQRGSSDDGDYRSIGATGDAAPSKASTLPMSATHAVTEFTSELSSYPKAAPRKVAASSDSKKKGKISKLFTGTNGRKKGRLTMDLMQDYSARRLSYDPDVVISGVLAVMSPYFNNGGRWDEARCQIRTGGSFECSRCVSGDPSSFAGEPSVLLNLGECSVESSSDKGRPLALSLLKSRTLQLTFVPCDRLQHGDWLAALLKYVDRSSRPVAATSTSSCSSSTSGSGDGVIQHSSCANVAAQFADKVSTAVDQASADCGTRQEGIVQANRSDAISNQSLRVPLYVNVNDAGKPALDDGSSSSDDDASYLEVDDGVVEHVAMQKSVCSPNIYGVQSGIACLSPSVNSTPAVRAEASVTVLTASGWKSHPSSTLSSAACSPVVTSSTAAAKEPTAVVVLPPDASPQIDSGISSDRTDGGSGGDEALSVQARILQAEAMARSTRLSPLPSRVKDNTLPTAQFPSTVTAVERTRPSVAAHANVSPAPAAIAAPSLVAASPSSPQASLHVPAAGPFVHSQHSPTALTSSTIRCNASVASGSTTTAELSGRSPSTTGKDKVGAATRSVPDSAATRSVLDAAATRAVQDGPQIGVTSLSELAPRKLAVSGGIARNRALFESSAATSSVAATSIVTNTIAAGTTNTASSPAVATSYFGSSGPSDVSRSTIAFADEAKKTESRAGIDTSKVEARLAIGSMVGRFAAAAGTTALPAAATVTPPSASVTVTVAVAGSKITTVGTPSTAVDDGRHAGAAAAADAESRQQLLEERRQRLAELRKQRNQLRAGRAAAPASERSRMEIEYRVLDDRCRELERLINELEDVNLMHIKAQRNAT